MIERLIATGASRFGVVALAAVCLWPGSASAADAPAAPDSAAMITQCLEAHTSVQELRKQHALLKAQDAAKGCMLAHCPTLARGECYAWSEELEKETPSVIFNVTSHDLQVAGSRVFVDDAVVQLSSSGAPLRLDPGHHTYRVEHAGYKPVTREIVLFEGQRFTQLHVDLEPLADPKARPPAMETYRPVPAVSYVLLGAGVAGWASFAGFAAAGLSAQHGLDKSCSPRCTDAQISSSGVHWKYVAADVSMGVGAVGLAAFVVSLAVRPTRERPVAVSLLPTPTGVFGSLVLKGM